MDKVTRPVKVEADVFSGIENPIWYLDSRVVQEVLTRLREVMPTPMELPSLGYRGLVVHLPEIELGDIRIFSGAATNYSKWWSDKNRAAERELLISAQGKIDSLLIEELLRQVT